MNRHSSNRDLTTLVKANSAGIDTRQIFVSCGHKGHKPGAHFRGNMPWRCAACVVALAKVAA